MTVGNELNNTWRDLKSLPLTNGVGGVTVVVNWRHIDTVDFNFISKFKTFEDFKDSKTL